MKEIKAQMSKVKRDLSLLESDIKYAQEGIDRNEDNDMIADAYRDRMKRILNKKSELLIELSRLNLELSIKNSKIMNPLILILSLISLLLSLISLLL